MANEQRDTAAREEGADSEEQPRETAAARRARERTERTAEEQNEAARSAQGLGADDLEDEEAEDDPYRDLVMEQNEAARHATANAREAAVYGGFGGEVRELPDDVKRPEVGDKVFYGLDVNGIVEWRDAEVTDAEPWQDGLKLPPPMSPAELHLAVHVDPRRHYAARPIVLRTNAPYGEEPGGWLPEKPRNADERYQAAVRRRATREGLRRDEMQAQAVAAGSTVPGLVAP